MTGEPSEGPSATGRETWGIRRWLIFGLMAVTPIGVTLLALAIVFWAREILGQFGVSVFDTNAPESRCRLLGMSMVILSNVADVVLLALIVIHHGTRRFLTRHSVLILDALACNALVALGVAFAVFDMSFNIGESTEAVLIALILGLAAAWPLFLGRGRGVRRLLLATAIYGAFAGWITVQRHIDWNMRRPFLRAYARIQPGMTREQIEAVMRQEFRGKRPVARWFDTVVQYTLDPEDGRFNSEFLIIQMKDGHVVSTDYSPD